VLTENKMNINETELAQIVRRVLNEAAPISGEAPQAQSKDADTTHGTVALVSTYLPKPAVAFEALKALSEDAPEVYTLNGATMTCAGCSGTSVENKADEYALMDRLAVAKTVVLVAPSIKTLRNIAQGEDDGFIENAMLRSVLWGRRVKVLLDFELPKFKRGSFFENIIEAVDALTSMGIGVTPYRIAKDATQGKAALITETEVIDAYNRAEKQVIAEANAIITPLARDKAKELNIHIKQG